METTIPSFYHEPVPLRMSSLAAVIDEICEIRHRISARFDHDPAKLVAYYMKLQKQYEDRLLKSDKGAHQSGTETTQVDRK